MGMIATHKETVMVESISGMSLGVIVLIVAAILVTPQVLTQAERQPHAKRGRSGETG